MRRIAVFGNAGGEVPHNEYLEIHSELLRGDRWIIDGFGCVSSAWERFSAADTLIYVDLPLLTHYLWVTKRLVKGLVVTPEGWPRNSPMWSSTLNSYRVLRLCHGKLAPRYRQLVAEQATHKRVHHLRSPGAMKAFVGAVTNEYSDIRRGDAQPSVSPADPAAASRRQGPG